MSTQQTATLWRAVTTELAAFDGRFETSWRIALVCALTTLVFMTYQVPLAAIACYLVLFVMKPDPAKTTLMAIAICVLVSLVVIVLFLMVRISIEVPLWRMVIIALGSFIFLFVGAASKLGPVGGIIALVIAFVMTLLADAPFGEVATRGILYAWLMALIPMGVIIAFNLVLGRSASRLLRHTLALRLQAVAHAVQAQGNTHTLLPLIRQGNTDLESYLKFCKLFHSFPSYIHRQLSSAAERSYGLLLHASRLTTKQIGHHEAATLRQACLLMAEALEQQRYEPLRDASEFIAGPERTLAELLHQFYTPAPEHPPSPPSGFFYSDALRNPDYQRFALKTTLSALLAYIIYTSLDWQDIHTAMITCYVAALGTTGETVHKLTLRIVGCLIGAAMGIASIYFLMPLMTSIGHLMVLVFVGTLVAGWVSSGSERSAYAGIQTGLAFLLTVLQGFGPDVKISVALDRVAGILLGNLILYLVFTRIWPISAASSVQRKLQQIAEQMAWFLKRRTNTTICTASQAAQMLSELNSAREQLALTWFEPHRLKPDQKTLNTLTGTLERSEQLCIAMAVSHHAPDSQISLLSRRNLRLQRVLAVKPL